MRCKTPAFAGHFARFVALLNVQRDLKMTPANPTATPKRLFVAIIDNIYKLGSFVPGLWMPVGENLQRKSSQRFREWPRNLWNQHPGTRATKTSRTLGRSFVQPDNVENTGAAPTHFKVSTVFQSTSLSPPRVLYIPLKLLIVVITMFE